MTNPAMQDLREEFLHDLNEAIDRMTMGMGEAPKAGPRPHRPRYRRIVVAYDGSEGAKLALAWTKEIAGLHGSEVLVANAFAPPTVTGANLGFAWYPEYAELYETAQKWAQNVADETADALREGELKASSHAMEGSAVREISELARAKHADLLITGASRRSAFQRLLGSTATGFLEHSPCSVFIARNAPPVTRVLAATDGSGVSYRAVAHALGLASELGTELVVEHVLEYPEQVEEKRSEGFLKGVIDKIELPAPPPRVRYVMDVGNAATRILARAKEEGVGLICMGSHGRGVVERMFVGSVSRRVAIESPTSVLVVKAVAE